MRDCLFGPTVNRGVVAIMNEFAYLADVYRHSGRLSQRYRPRVWR